MPLLPLPRKQEGPIQDLWIAPLLAGLAIRSESNRRGKMSRSGLSTSCLMILLLMMSLVDPPMTS